MNGRVSQELRDFTRRALPLEGVTDAVIASQLAATRGGVYRALKRAYTRLPRPERHQWLQDRRADLKGDPA